MKARTLLRPGLAALFCIAAGMASAQTGSASPGSPPLTGDSFPPGSGVPSVPVPMTGSPGSGTGASTGTGTVPGVGGGTASPTGPSSVPPASNVQGYIDQAEMARCNAMLGAAREQCVGDLRARSESGYGARTGPGGALGNTAPGSSPSPYSSSPSGAVNPESPAAGAGTGSTRSRPDILPPPQ